MKAVCIHCCSKSLFNPDTYKFHLTQGKTYEVIDSKQTPEKERPHMYKIIMMMASKDGMTNLCS